MRNGIAMCLALSIAYALDLDEPYWAMTSAAVVSFPTVGGVISKVLAASQAACSAPAPPCCLPVIHSTILAVSVQYLRLAGALHLGLRPVHQQRRLRLQLAGYTCAIIAFPVINISDSYELWVIAQSRVCEVIVGILCGGLMMMILPSTSDGSNLLTALKTMHARLLEHASLLWVPETTDAIRTAHESVIGQILTMNLLRIQAFWSHYRFRRQNPLLNYLLHQQLRMTSVISSLRRMLLNWPDAPANTRRYWSRCSPSSPPSCRQLSRCADPGAAGAAAGCRLPAHRFLGAIALFLSHLPEQPLDPPR
nr:FUSC family protein [Klebsiella pneumoniae subsp. pneumoniae]